VGTKKTTTTTNAYDPSSMTFFQGLQPQLQAGYKNDLQVDPTKSTGFNLGLQNAYAAARQQGLRNINTLAANRAFSTGNNMSGMQQSLLATQNRSTAGQMANAYISNYLNYDTMRRQEQMQASGIKPLQTGQTQVQQTSGLGTWLPQVIGTAAQIGLGVATGGMSGLAKGAMSAVGGVVGNSAAQATAGDNSPSSYIPDVQWNQNPLGSTNAFIPQYSGNPNGLTSFNRF
jgi:hypothetical protein